MARRGNVRALHLHVRGGDPRPYSSATVLIARRGTHPTHAHARVHGRDNSARDGAAAFTFFFLQRHHKKTVVSKKDLPVPASVGGAVQRTMCNAIQ